MNQFRPSLFTKEKIFLIKPTIQTLQNTFIVLFNVEVNGIVIEFI